MAVRQVSDARLLKVRRILRKVNAFADQMRGLSDAELQNETPHLKERLAKGESLDAILPEAYAAIREAAKRVLGMFPYDVQVMGGIVLHQGAIAEMKTGEGKTLVATMPLYLNALTGKLCVLVTMNSYLAVRDGQQMSKLFNWMGLSLGIGCSEDDHQFSNAEKKEIYACDIVYTTSSALGFDYLLNNLETSPKTQFLRDYYYCIIDEADSVLLDMAMTPLIISGAPRVQSNLYEIADGFVSTLHEGVDYETEDKEVWLTESGVDKAQGYFRYDNLFDESHVNMMRHINLALRARTAFQLNKDYVVEDGKIKLLDQKTARILENNKLSAGLHQALETKEHVNLTREMRSMASITYQSLFNLFPKISGMTGTGINDEAELQETYGVDVIPIPTNHPVRRVDYPDVVYVNHEAAVDAAMQELLALHKNGEGQPILVVASSINMSNAFSRRLLDLGIPHNVLNAYNTAKEAQIVAEAGRRGAVTVATAVAGRGTDIKLTDEVKKMGGLAVLGVGRMASRREELQARGRAGRQGDPGFSRFYVSPEDDVCQEFGSDALKSLVPEDGAEGEPEGTVLPGSQVRREEYDRVESEAGRTVPSGSRENHGDTGSRGKRTGPFGVQDSDGRIRSRRVLQQIRRAQLICEERGRSSREQITQFDESMTYQRNLMYATRNRFMRECTEDIGYYMDIEDRVIRIFAQEHVKDINEQILLRYVLENVSYRVDIPPDELTSSDVVKASRYIHQMAERVLTAKLAKLPDAAMRQTFLRLMTLKAIDDVWIEQVDFLQQLRQSVSGRRYAQKNVMYEYHEESYHAFQKMEQQIWAGMMRNILLGSITQNARGGYEVMLP